MRLKNVWRAASTTFTVVTTHLYRSVCGPPGRTTGPMSLSEPFRGEVWNVDFDDFGQHPAVVLSINPLNARLGHVAVVPVTGTAGPEQTHIPLNADAGLTKCEQSYADVTALQPVARSRLLTRRGLLTREELDRLGRQLTVYLAL